MKTGMSFIAALFAAAAEKFAYQRFIEGSAAAAMPPKPPRSKTPAYTKGRRYYSQRTRSNRRKAKRRA